MAFISPLPVYPPPCPAGWLRGQCRGLQAVIAPLAGRHQGQQTWHEPAAFCGFGESEREMGRDTEGDTQEETHRLAHTPQDIDGTLIG